MPPLRRCLLALLLFVLLPESLFAANIPTATVVMLSDIHFDPFRDPGKVQELRTAPIDRWPAILNAADTPTAAVDLQALQTACGARALDTAWPLLKATLSASHTAEPRPGFVTLSGDLLTHDFPCRFEHTSPGASPGDLAAFAAKTVNFVLAQLRGAFPRTPVFAALGNNDSGCADYRETPDDAFLRATAPSLPPNTSAPPPSLSPEGDYAVSLPAPLQHGRLIVLQDIFESRQFALCAGSAAPDSSGAADGAPERAQMDWLRAELTAARQAHEHVWLMAHIPPGVDVYTSYRRYLLQPTNMCAATPRPFLADTALADALLDYADVVSLALFGHTHMDEFRLLDRPASGSARAAAVPAKLVPSISPIFGNHPAFLVATVDPANLVLLNWRTIVSPGPEGSAAPWTEAYRFTSAFHLPDFSAASARRLADGLAADPSGQSALASAYRAHFYAGDIGLYALGLAQIWPAYACAVHEVRPSAVQKCLCALEPKPAQ